MTAETRSQSHQRHQERQEQNKSSGSNNGGGVSSGFPKVMSMIINGLRGGNRNNQAQNSNSTENNYVTSASEANEAQQGQQQQRNILFGNSKVKEYESSVQVQADAEVKQDIHTKSNLSATKTETGSETGKAAKPRSIQTRNLGRRSQNTSASNSQTPTRSNSPYLCPSDSPRQSEAEAGLMSPGFTARKTPSHSRKVSPRNTPSPPQSPAGDENEEPEFALPGSAPSSEESDEPEGEVIQDLHPLFWIKLLLPYANENWRPDTNVQRPLPPQRAEHRGRNTLVLDLDETLLHCSMEPLPTCDHFFTVEWNGFNYQIWARKRPFMEEFLRLAAAKFEVVVFTASQRVYADQVLNRIDPTGEYIHHRMFREHCRNQDGNFIKDLRVLGRDLRRTMIIDNMAQAFAFQLDNGYPIESWYDNVKDRELEKAWNFVEKLATVADVRPAIIKRHGLREKVESLPMPPNMII